MLPGRFMALVGGLLARTLGPFNRYSQPQVCTVCAIRLAAPFTASDNNRADEEPVHVSGDRDQRTSEQLAHDCDASTGGDPGGVARPAVWQPGSLPVPPCGAGLGNGLLM